jgi:drug/metabolite transporter (DMT)-like permease
MIRSEAGRRDRFSVLSVQAMAGISLAFAVLTNPSLGGWGDASMPTYLGFLYVGVLGTAVSQALRRQHRRIAELERELQGQTRLDIQR